MALMYENLLEHIELEPAKTANSSMIWLHGLGASGDDFAALASELNFPVNINMRFIFPHAPVRPVTVNNGYKMRAWFDLYNMNFQGKVDKEGIEESILEVEKLIQREVERGIPSKRIFLGGFSQGSAIALATGLYHSKPLGGILGLSGFFPFSGEVRDKANPANQETPIFIAHGTEDLVVPYVLGEATQRLLAEANYKVTWKSYPIAHTVCAEEIKDISQWTQKLLA